MRRDGCLRTYALLKFTVLGLALLAAGCTVGPDYHRPPVTTPAVYKEAAGWTQAAPADAQLKGAWWAPFADPVLNDLETRVAVSNQNIAAFAAAYAQAQALVRVQRAAFFPVLGVSGSEQRSHSASRSGSSAGFSTSGGTGLTGAGTNSGFSSSSGRTVTSHEVDATVSWEPDLWGRVQRSVENAGATAEASAADLANAQLSAQAALAVAYWQLREADAETALVERSIDGYRRALQITQNRYTAHIAAKSDVTQAQTTLANAESQRETLLQRRAQLEHAIAVLAGEAPGNFTLAAAAWNQTIPPVPPAVPSALLQRRPDVAAAERRMAAANAQIGVQTAAFYPIIDLTASAGSSAALSQLFNASNYFWSLGLSVAETVFEGGGRSAAVDAAKAAYDQSVASYRETVLTAFQGVEDQLTAISTLSRQYDYLRAASAAADETEQLTLNQYRAGLINYTNVVTVQASALAARTALVQALRDRQTATVSLIAALGGGWGPGPATMVSAGSGR